MKLADALLRMVLTAGHQMLKAGWFVRRPRTFGAHAFALTPERQLILIKLRYASGWRLPGGGREADESPADAVLRELREEIGMTSHGNVRLAREIEQRPGFKRDLASLLIIEDVRYSPRWSWEVEQIIESHPEDLPSDLAPIAREWINALRGQL